MPVIPISRLTPRAISWLWLRRLARGSVAILDGDPGLGKSLVTLDLCARISTGRPFPDGSPASEPANCLVLNGEDIAEETIYERLKTFGADLDRVFVLQAESNMGIVRLPNDWKQLDDALARTGARFVVIDPIMAFLGRRIVAGSDASVRRALLPLVRLAEKHGCTILLVRHLNKTHGGVSVYRGAGSIAFLAVCRSGWLIARDPSASGQCVLAQIKNNLAPAQPSLAYTVEINEPHPPLLHWHGIHPLGADDILASRRAPRALRPVHLARDFLRAFLAEGPRTTRDIWTAACKEGYSQTTLRRARRLVDVQIAWIPINGHARRHWHLPEHTPPPAAPSLEPWLAPLREQYPPSTLLDEL
jgi:hypothetical protein